MQIYCGRLPAETIHVIISSSAAHYIDDFILGPLSLRSNALTLIAGKENQTTASSPNPVVSLLAASHQLRTITVEVLSKALGTAFSDHGLGIMAVKPWSRISPVRKFMIKEPGTDVTSMGEVEAAAYFHPSPVMCVYVAMHVINMELQLASKLCTEPSDHVDPLLPPDLQPPGPMLRWMPVVFREVIKPRLQETMVNTDIVVISDVSLLVVKFAWFRLKSIIPIVENVCSSAIHEATKRAVDCLLSATRSHFYVAQRWRDALDLDQKIGVERLSDWCTLMCDALYEGHLCELLEDLRTSLEELLQSFTKRLDKLSLLATASAEVPTTSTITS